MSQQDPNRKFNPNNIPPLGDDKKKPKLNIYWIYGLVAVALIGYTFFKGVSPSGVKSDFEKVKVMLLENDVDTIVIVNKKIVKIHIQEDSLKNKAAIYTKLLGAENYEIAKKIKNSTPQVNFTIGDLESYSRELETFYAKYPNVNRPPSFPEEPGEWYSFLIKIGRAHV